MMFSKVAILGAGLLGGSLALALRDRCSVAGSVHLWARRRETVDEVLALDGGIHASTDLAAAVAEAELVVLCTTVGAMPEVAAAARPHLSAFAIVTDVGSVKRAVCDSVGTALDGAALFVGSHPMAGSENAGFAAARADLFTGSVCIVTPEDGTDPAALRQVDGFWQALGMEVRRLDPDLHDRLIARISHLPHLLAATLVNAATTPDAEALPFSGGGFRDSTRIAGGPAPMWREILLSNRDAVLASLDAYAAELSRARALVEKGDADGLLEFLSRARDHRRLLQPRAKGDE